MLVVIDEVRMGREYSAAEISRAKGRGGVLTAFANAHYLTNRS